MILCLTNRANLADETLGEIKAPLSVSPVWLWL